MIYVATLSYPLHTGGGYSLNSDAHRLADVRYCHDKAVLDKLVAAWRAKPYNPAIHVVSGTDDCIYLQLTEFKLSHDSDVMACSAPRLYKQRYHSVNYLLRPPVNGVIFKPLLPESLT